MLVPPHPRAQSYHSATRGSDPRATPPAADRPRVRLPVRPAHLHALVAAIAAPPRAVAAAVTTPAPIDAAPAATIPCRRLEAAAAVAACRAMYVSHTLA